MSKQKKTKKKLKQSLSHIIKEVFTENSESSLNHKQVCSLINVKESALRKLVYTILEDLGRSNFLKKEGYDSYKLNASNSIFEGVLQITTRGSGFVIMEDKEMADIFVPERFVNQSLGGDVVRVRVKKEAENVLKAKSFLLLKENEHNLLVPFKCMKNMLFLFLIIQELVLIYLFKKKN